MVIVNSATIKTILSKSKFICFVSLFQANITTSSNPLFSIFNCLIPGTFVVPMVSITKSA